MKRILFSTGLILIGVMAVAGYFAYGLLWKSNVSTPNGKPVEIYVGSNWTYDSLRQALDPYLITGPGFDQLADQMNLRNKVIPGKYIIQNGWTNRRLIRHFRSGNQEQVVVLLKGSIDRRDIIRELSLKLEPDSTAFDAYIDTSSYLRSLELNRENWPCLMMANTYFFHWAAKPDAVFKRFKSERDVFWTPERMGKLNDLDLTINDVIVLASIVDAETMFDSELPRIAGVYLNRLEKGWPLQADPTVRYIAHKAGRRRVLHVDLKVDNPYNTYKYRGLPPGPVLLPSVKAVDAVLNAESHDYMFVCAKPDLSGYHLFTASARVHEQNAVNYHKALDARNIRE